jgi:hypothetical protein
LRVSSSLASRCRYHSSEYFENLDVPFFLTFLAGIAFATALEISDIRGTSKHSSISDYSLEA